MKKNKDMVILFKDRTTLELFAHQYEQIMEDVEAQVAERGYAAKLNYQDLHWDAEGQEYLSAGLTKTFDWGAVSRTMTRDEWLRSQGHTTNGKGDIVIMPGAGKVDEAHDYIPTEWYFKWRRKVQSMMAAKFNEADWGLSEEEIQIKLLVGKIKQAKKDNDPTYLDSSKNELKAYLKSNQRMLEYAREELQQVG